MVIMSIYNPEAHYFSYNCKAKVILKCASNPIHRRDTIILDDGRTITDLKCLCSYVDSDDARRQGK